MMILILALIIILLLVLYSKRKTNRYYDINHSQSNTSQSRNEIVPANSNTILTNGDISDYIHEEINKIMSCPMPKRDYSALKNIDIKYKQSPIYDNYMNHVAGTVLRRAENDFSIIMTIPKDIRYIYSLINVVKTVPGYENIFKDAFGAYEFFKVPKRSITADWDINNVSGAINDILENFDYYEDLFTSKMYEYLLPALQFIQQNRETPLENMTAERINNVNNILLSKTSAEELEKIKYSIIGHAKYNRETYNSARQIYSIYFSVIFLDKTSNREIRIFPVPMIIGDYIASKTGDINFNLHEEVGNLINYLKADKDMQGQIALLKNYFIDSENNDLAQLCE